MTDGGAFWVGGYTPEMGGSGSGISRWRADGDAFVAAGPAHPTPSPSFLARHPRLPVLYSADESAGTVSAFRITAAGGELSPLGSRPAGPAVCHVAVSPSGDHLAATCWGDGTVALYPIDPEGALGEPVFATPAEDPHPALRATTPPPAGLEASSRAHMSLWLGPEEVVTTDLGYDLLRVFSVRDGRLHPTSTVELPFGCGPRHLVALSDDLLVVCTEYSCEALSVVRDGAGRRLAARLPLTPDSPRPGETAAHIEASPGGLLHVGLRGSDRIAVLRCDEAGALAGIGAFASGGSLPRHHAVEGRVLRVAHQGSDEITTHRVDDGGLSTGVVDRAAVGSPTMILAS